MKTFVALLALALFTSCSRKPSQTEPSPEKAPAPAYFHVDATTAGSISGSVHWSGHRPALVAIDMSSDPACVGANKAKVYDDSLIIGKSNQVANAFIYIKSGLEGKVFEPPSVPAIFDQRGCWFHPRVLGLQTGQELEIVNSDPVTHNIHPLAHLNREWNHSQQPGDPPMKRKFSKQEIIPVKCNIHSWMHAYLGIVDNPYFVVSGQDGSFTLPNLPPGTYTVALWHEKSGTQEQKIIVPPNGSATVTFDVKPQ